MELYQLPASTPAPPAPADPTAPRDYWSALRAEGKVELIHEPPDPAQAPLGYADPVIETRHGREVAVAYPRGTPEERATAQLLNWRGTTVLGPFEARAALLATGQLEAVEALMADPSTPELVRLAWNKSTVFPRNSPALALLSAAMNWSDADLDALFRAGETAQVIAMLTTTIDPPQEPPLCESPP